VWHSIFVIPIPVIEKVVRTVLVYATIVLLFRLAGKRGLASLNTLDFVVLFLLSNVVQNAIIGADNTLLGGLIGATVLVAVNAGVVRLARRNDEVAMLLEGTSTTLALDGQWDTKALAKEGLRKADVDAALRRQNANSVEETHLVSIEPGGAIIATLREDLQTATRADVQRLEAKLDALLARSA
jgi:uncharacterized membrane protein YcaP (DUF421 family)